MIMIIILFTAIFLYPRFCISQPDSSNICDPYGRCGAFGSCNPQDSPPCTCLPGFDPNIPVEWAAGNWTGGCRRKIPLSCETNNSSRQQDGFFELQMMKFPNYTTWWVGPESECRGQCLINCSCVAYAYNSGVGCMFWRGTLIDTQRFPGGSSLHTYIRVADSELDGKKGGLNKIILVPVLTVFIIMSVCIGILWKWLAKRRGRQRRDFENTLDSIDPSLQDTLSKFNLEELPLFGFEVLANATNNFSDANKLGKGGFGPVYKGVLENGKEIAVKRLSKASDQGMQEFMNEVLLISNHCKLPRGRAFNGFMQ